MDSYASQFQVIVGHNYTPNQELDEDQSRALTALIFSMPDIEVTRDGEFIDYAGWSAEQNIHLSVTVDADHRRGAQAVCVTLDQLDDVASTVDAEQT